MGKTKKNQKRTKIKLKKRILSKRKIAGNEKTTPSKKRQMSETDTWAPRKGPRNQDDKPVITLGEIDLDKFDDLQNMIGNLTPIGQESRNGFVVKFNIGDKKYGDKKYVLKSSRTETSESGIIDNLMYEYECGLKINSFLTTFPCFIKTFRLFIYDKNNGKRIMRSYLKNKPLLTEKENAIRLGNISKTLNPIPMEEDLDYDCAIKNDYALLLDYFPGISLSKSKYAKQNKTPDEWIPTDILFQIFAPLYTLGSDNFRHLDLHTGNVMIHELESEICLKYYFNDDSVVESNMNEGNYEETPIKEVTIYTRYIVKLVDYGRAYLKEITDNYFKKIQELKGTEEEKLFENILIKCGLGHIVKNRYNNSHADLLYLTNDPNFIWTLNTAIEKMGKGKASSDESAFTVHIDCKKYSDENERKGMFYTGNIPSGLDLEIFGVVSSEKIYNV